MTLLDYVIFKFCFLHTVFLQAEQNSSLHEGHCTAHNSGGVVILGPSAEPAPSSAPPPLFGLRAEDVDVDAAAADADEVEGATSVCCVLVVTTVEPIKQTVSQPARGHQVRVLSNSISIYPRKVYDKQR